MLELVVLVELLDAVLVELLDCVLVDEEETVELLDFWTTVDKLETLEGLCVEVLFSTQVEEVVLVSTVEVEEVVVSLCVDSSSSPNIAPSTTKTPVVMYLVTFSASVRIAASRS